MILKLSVGETVQISHIVKMRLRSQKRNDHTAVLMSSDLSERHDTCRMVLCCPSWRTGGKKRDLATCCRPWAGTWLNWKFSRWPRQSGACSTCPRRRGWGTWTSSAWRREGFWEDLTESPPRTNREIIENREPGCSSQCMVEGWETVEISWNERFGIDKRKNFLTWGQLDSGTGYAGRVCRLHPWRISRPDWIKLWAILFDLIADHALIRRFI